MYSLMHDNHVCGSYSRLSVALLWAQLIARAGYHVDVLKEIL